MICSSLFALNASHVILLVLSLGLFTLLRFAQIARFQSDHYNMILEIEMKKLLDILKKPQPLTKDDIGREFVIRSIINNGLIVFGGESGDIDKLRFIPLENKDIEWQKLKAGQKRIFQGIFNVKNECEIPNFLPVETDA